VIFADFGFIRVAQTRDGAKAAVKHYRALEGADPKSDLVPQVGIAERNLFR